MKVCNYEIAREQAKKLFLTYDQERVIKKWRLPYDDHYLYVTFIDRYYRISRQTGTVQWSVDDFVTSIEADFNVTLTIFDLLCCSKEGCYASGQYDIVKNLKGTGYTSDPGGDIYRSYKKEFDLNRDKLPLACEKLGGEFCRIGDVAYIIPIFADLRMLFQFWASDDEFDAEIKMKWDTNVLSYMHFETVYYAMGHVLERIKENIV